MVDTSSQVKVFCEESLESDEDLYDGVPLQSLSSLTITPGQYTPLDNCDFDEKYAPEPIFQEPAHETKLESHYKVGYLSHNGSVDKLITCDTIPSSRNDATGYNSDAISNFGCVMVSLHFIESFFFMFWKLRQNSKNTFTMARKTNKN